jgi:hypothetical protein
MNAVEDYAKRRVKREDEELDSLSKWAKGVEEYQNHELKALHLKNLIYILLYMMN